MKKNIKIALIILSVVLFVMAYFMPELIYAGIILLLVISIYDSAKEPSAEVLQSTMTFEDLSGEFEEGNKAPSILISNDSYYETESFKRQIRKETHDSAINLLDPNKAKQKIDFNYKSYDVFCWNLTKEIKCFSFFEAKEAEPPEEACRIGNVCVSLIFIDNYFDVMETIEESRKPLVIALIDRKINAFVQSVEGVVKKFEKDRYIFIFDGSKLEAIKQKKFYILDQIREIDMGNKVPITLSIGIGINGRSLHHNMEYARAAIDLALGRGGDQALIKDGENYQFFGGKAREIEINSGVRARVKAYAMTELINECSDVLIMGHRNADLDCLGAGVGIYRIVSDHGKKAHIVLNDVSTSIKGMYDKLMEISCYREGCFITGEEALEKIGYNTLLVVVDSHRPSILECPELIERSHKTVVIDHHRKGAEFVKNPVLTYHEPYASSTCELITDMLRYLNLKIQLSATEADALLAGITVDTKNYVIKTGTKTFEAAAYLKRSGADTIRVRMVMQNDMESYKAKAMAVNNAKIFMENIAIAVCPAYVENPELTTAQISDDLLNITGIEASFAAYFDHAGEKVHISARSLGGINVQRIMEKMGGGGHQTAAGTQIVSEDMEEVMERLEESIESYLNSNKIEKI